MKTLVMLLLLSTSLVGCASMGKFMQDVGQNQMAHNNPPRNYPKKMTCKPKVLSYSGEDMECTYE